MGKVIVIGSQKGGVGKTTTTLNLAHSLQCMGKKILTRTILEKRYLCFDTWEQISVDMGYSIQHTFRLHDKALKEIDGFLKVES